MGSVGQCPCCCQLPGKGDHIPACFTIPPLLSSPAVRVHSSGPDKSRASGTKNARSYATLSQLPSAQRTLPSCLWPEASPSSTHPCPPSHSFRPLGEARFFLPGNARLSLLDSPFRNVDSLGNLAFFSFTFPAPERSRVPPLILKIAFHPLKPLGLACFMYWAICSSRLCPHFHTGSAIFHHPPDLCSYPSAPGALASSLLSLTKHQPLALPRCAPSIPCTTGHVRDLLHHSAPTSSPFAGFLTSDPRFSSVK